MSEDKLQKQSVLEKNSPDATSQQRRRRLLKKSIAIPIIMTLNSGAALARTSNLTGDAEGNYAILTNNLNQSQLICAQPDLAEDQSSAPPYDLGIAPQATLGDPNLSLDDQAVACRNGGGIVLSASAFTSLQGRLSGIE